MYIHEMVNNEVEDDGWHWRKCKENEMEKEKKEKPKNECREKMKMKITSISFTNGIINHFYLSHFSFYNVSKAITREYIYTQIYNIFPVPSHSYTIFNSLFHSSSNLFYLRNSILFRLIVYTLSFSSSSLNKV